MSTQRRVFRSPLANVDILEIVRYLGYEGSQRTSDRFVAALVTTSVLLQSTPFIGRRCGAKTPGTEPVRRICVHRPFDKWLLFYTPLDRHIRIERVLHGARNWFSLFP